MTVDSLHELELYKLQNTPVGKARQSLDDYEDIAETRFLQIRKINEEQPAADIPK